MADEIDGLKSRVPPEFRDGFIFHATNLYYCGKWRNEWSDEARRGLLDDLVAVPRKMKVPLVIGVAHKPVKELRNKPMLDSFVIHALAYLHCLKPADTYMNDFAAPEEIGMIVAEERKAYLRL